MATILIVDDSKSETALMQSIAEQLGHSVITADNGRSGAQMAEQFKPSLVLLDIVMPEQDGFVTCRQIKKNPVTSQIPIVLVSSKSGESDQFWGLRQGASDYITKPFAPESLAGVMYKHLS